LAGFVRPIHFFYPLLVYKKYSFFFEWSLPFFANCSEIGFWFLGLQPSSVLGRHSSGIVLFFRYLFRSLSFGGFFFLFFLGCSLSLWSQTVIAPSDLTKKPTYFATDCLGVSSFHVDSVKTPFHHQPFRTLCLWRGTCGCSLALFSFRLSWTRLFFCKEVRLVSLRYLSPQAQFLFSLGRCLRWRFLLSFFPLPFSPFVVVLDFFLLSRVAGTHTFPLLPFPILGFFVISTYLAGPLWFSCALVIPPSSRKTLFLFRKVFFFFFFVSQTFFFPPHPLLWF